MESTMSQTENRKDNLDMSKVYDTSVPWLLHGIVTIVILIIAIAIVASLMSSKPKANRWGERTAPSVAVEVIALKAQSYDVWVDSYGTAESLTRTNLVSDVNGRVMSVSPNIRPGKNFKQGEVLATLDDRDLKVDVDIAASAAAEAEVVYLQEVAQAEFAAEEWNEKPQSEAARKLALREPQVAAAKASLRAAKARLERAKLDLQRTQIIAPFDGKVLSQMVDVGQVVSPSQAIAEIYSTDVVEVRLPVKMSELQHLILPESGTYTENVTNEEKVFDSDYRPKVILESDLGNQTYQWQGEIVRTEGAFDPTTRMLFVVAQVTAPFIHNSERPAMRIGQFVRARLEGKQYQNVYVIPRRAISQDLQVAIASEGVLQKRQVMPLWTDNNSVVISADSGAYSDSKLALAGNDSVLLQDSDMLILTPTANLPNGTRVKPIGEKPDRENIANNPSQSNGGKASKAGQNDKSGRAANTANSGGA